MYHAVNEFQLCPFQSSMLKLFGNKLLCYDSKLFGRNLKKY